MSMMESNNLITESKLVFAEFKAWKNIIVPINKTETVTLLPGNDYIEMQFSRDGNPFIFYGKLYGFDNLYNVLKTTNSKIVVPLATLKELSGILKKNVVSVDFSSSAVVYKYLSKEDATVTLEIKLDLIALEGNKDNEISYLKEIKLDENLVSNEILKVFLDDQDNLTEERTHRKLFEFPTSKIWSILDKTNTFIRFSKEENSRRFVEIYSKKDNLELHQLFLTI